MARIVFMGTPDFAVPTLRALIAQHEVVGVVTQPDRPAGRKRQLHMSPVKRVALENGIPVIQPEKLRRPEALESLKAWNPEAYVVAAFGQILSQAALDIPPLGSINVHASLLPRWRGAAPIQAAIRHGDSETGITIMKMDAGLDTGPMLAQETILIASDETGQTLHDKLALVGSRLLIAILPEYLFGVRQPQSQDDSLATYAPQVTKEEGNIPWQMDADTIERLVRAFTPWPGTFTFWNNQQLKIHAGNIGAGNAEPGLVVETPRGTAIGTGDGLFYPSRLQLAGRNAVSVAEFIRGYTGFVGSRLFVS